MSNNAIHPHDRHGAGSIVIALAATDSVVGEQWVHLLPIGNVTPNDGRGPWHVVNADNVIDNSMAYAGARKIPIDYDHQIDNAPKNGQPAPAAGWITQLQSRNDGIWGLVEWTAKARSYIAAKEYRYLSPVFNHTRDGEVIKLLRAALTNRPALELTALANSAQETQLPGTGDLLAQLRTLLGLVNDADFNAIHEAVRNLMGEPVNPQVELAQLSNLSALQQTLAATEDALKKSEETVLAAQIDKTIIEGRILPSHRDFTMRLSQIDSELFEQFTSFVSGFIKPIKNFQTGGLPPERRGVENHTQSLDETEQAICRSMGHTKEEFVQLGAAHDY